MSPTLSSLTHYAKTIGGLIYPNLCLYCNRFISVSPTLPLCSECESRLSLNKPPYCEHCGRHLPQGQVCEDCVEVKRMDIDAAFFLFRHQALAKKLLYKFKINQSPYVTPLVQNMIADFVREAPARFFDVDMITPVPPHRRQMLRLSRPSSFVLAELVSELSGKTAKVCLRRIRTVSKQSSLGREARLKNPEGSIGLIRHQRPLPSSVLLVDDVFTTGATAQACASALKSEGVKRVSIFTLARG